MTTNQLLRKRLGVALGQTVAPAEFSWFFARWCEYSPQYAHLKTAKHLTAEQVMAFSRYAGYDLRFPIPLPLLEKI